MSFGLSQRSVLALTALLLVGTSACSKKTVQTPSSEPIRQTTEITTDQPESPTTTRAQVELQDVFFDYDQSRIRGDAIAALNANGKALLADPTLRVTLEGHCDERGTVEYNLALGDRRARAAKDYLVTYGVEAGRLSTVSYGEERPFAHGSNESAWAQNRRVHFVKGGETGSRADQSN